MEQALYNAMYKTSEELKQERMKALDWYTENWEKVTDAYWNEYGETLSKNFYIDNLPDDELADFILANFDEEVFKEV